MGWLDRFKLTKRDPDDLAPGDGISLRVSQAVEIGYVSDLTKLFDALTGLPEGSTIYLEGTSFAPEVTAWLESASVPTGTLVTRGTIWPKPTAYDIPATPQNLSTLARLSERHAEPEMCDHLVVFRGDQVLVSAYDAGYDTVFAQRDLPADVIERLRQAVRR
jgi:hypothetical protein